MWQPMDGLMRFRRFAPVALLFVAPVAAREPVGAFATWSVFCDEPKHCFAVSVPAESRGKPFLLVGIAGARPAIQAHLGRRARTAALMIGDRRFDLDVIGQDVTADQRTGQRILAAMREEETLTLVGTSVAGGHFRHHYSLLGALSAIDAAIVASLR